MRDYDLVVVFEIGFGRQAQIISSSVRADPPPILVRPAAKNVLLGIERVVNANIKLIGKDRVGYVQRVIVEGIIVDSTLDRQWIVMAWLGTV